MTRSLAAFILVVPIALAALPAAANDAGSVLFAKGSVVAERQPPVDLAKGDGVLTSDTVATGLASRAQLLMIDGAKIAIRPESRLVIEEYSTAGTGAPRSSVTTSGERGVLNLVKGGFRTITGALGEDDPAEYEVRTPVGVLGIRGTDYATVFCNGDCETAPGVAADDGLYIGVLDGIVTFRNARGTIDIFAGEYVFIPLVSGVPEDLAAPPPVLLQDDLPIQVARDPADDDDPGFVAGLNVRRTAPAAATASLSTDDSTAPVERPSSTPPLQTIAFNPDGDAVDLTAGSSSRQPGPRSIAYASAGLGTLDTLLTSSAVNAADEYLLQQDFDLAGFQMPTGRQGGGDTAIFAIDSASNVDTGFDDLTVLRWGRWSGGTVSVVQQPSGTSEQVSLANQSIHWISSPDAAPPVMPVTGTASYSLIGATSPTDDQGNVGTLGAATFSADFTNFTVDSTLSIAIAGSNWTAAGNGTIGPQALLPAHLFQGFYNVVVDGQSGGFGTFTGFFSGPGPTSDPSLPGGVGLTYSLQDAQGAITVSGAAAFGNP